MFSVPSEEYCSLESASVPVESKTQVNEINKGIRKSTNPINHKIGSQNVSSGLTLTDVKTLPWYSRDFQRKLKHDAAINENAYIHIPILSEIEDDKEREHVMKEMSKMQFVNKNGTIDACKYFNYNREYKRKAEEEERQEQGHKRQRTGGKSNKRRRSNKKNIKRTTTLKSNKSNKRHKVNRR